MLMAQSGIQSLEHTGQGRMDVLLSGQVDDDYVIELKLYKEEIPKNGTLDPPISVEEITELRKLMSPLAQDSLKQINKRYIRKFKGGSGRVIKVALVIARRILVLAQFEVVG
jgi:hypothetical protein